MIIDVHAIYLLVKNSLFLADLLMLWFVFYVKACFCQLHKFFYSQGLVPMSVKTAIASVACYLFEIWYLSIIHAKLGKSMWFCSFDCGASQKPRKVISDK